MYYYDKSGNPVQSFSFSKPVVENYRYTSTEKESSGLKVSTILILVLLGVLSVGFIFYMITRIRTQSSMKYGMDRYM
jgi:hypothetical protein